MSSLRLIAIYLLVQLAGCSPQKSKMREIDDLFAGWDNPNSPGCAVLVLHKDKVTYQKAFGMASISDSLEIQTTTRFHVASITKQITGMAIAILEDRAMIDLNDKVSNYIPQLPQYGESITVKQLLNHTSGVPEYQYLEELAGLDGRQGTSEEVFFQLLESVSGLNNVPGERFIYSNSNYILLSILIERVSGKSYEEFVRDEILDPLEMSGGTFLSELLGDFPIARGYLENNQVDEPSLNPDAVLGHSGLIASADDLGKWTQNLLGNKILKRNAVDLRPGTGHYNYGLQYFEHNGLPTISHGGVHYGFRSTILLFPTEEFAVIITGNIDDQSFFYNTYAIADILLSDVYEKKTVTKDPVQPSDLDKFEGKFTNQYMDEVVQITSSDSGLVVKNFQSESTLQTFPFDELTFEFSGSSGEKVFQFNQNLNELEITDYDGSLGRFYKSDDFQTKSVSSLGGVYQLENSELIIELRVDEDGNINSDFESIYFNNFSPITGRIWMNENVNMLTMRFDYNEDSTIQSLSLSLDRLKDLKFVRIN